MDSAEELYAIIQAAPIGMIVFDENEKVLFSNSYAEELFENETVEVKGMRCGDFIRCEYRYLNRKGCGASERCPECALDQAIKAVLSEKSDETYVEGEARVVTDISSQSEYYSFKVNSLHIRSRKCVILSLYNITVQKQAESTLKVASEEKTRLMIEMNHRIKNNLSLVSSLIALKQEEVGSNVDLSDIRNQVRTIMLIHEKLYHTTELQSIHLVSYIEGLLEDIFSFYQDTNVKMETSVEDISLPTKAVVSVALILNELATNAIKHAFPGESDPRFSVALYRTGDQNEIIIKISNNGKKIPDGIDFTTAHSLGLRLIFSLVRQLDGTLYVEREPHTKVTIHLPLKPS